jgi:SNF2 family DNA or RNA helicase/uncharacterized Zn finger protein
MANIFGKTWWGAQWLQSLNNIDYSNRLPRGSSYARNGAVNKIEIKDNRILAKVNGSRAEPYDVDIILPPFFDPELNNFIDAISKRPVIISKLLNRELDPEILSIAEAKGLKVFPQQWTDFKMYCSCPDWAVPCKHLAAVIYKVSAEIDNNPFLVLSLHKVDLIVELQKRGIVISNSNTEIPNMESLLIGKHTKGKTVKKTNSESAYLKLSYTDLKTIHEPLISLLAASPVFYQGSGDFKQKYAVHLNRVVKNAQRIIQGKQNLEILIDQYIGKEQRPIINTHSSYYVSVDEQLQSNIWDNQTSFSVLNYLSQLVKLPTNKTNDYQASTASLHTVLFSSLHLIATGSIVPQMVQHSDKSFFVRWLPAMLSQDVRNLVLKLEEIVDVIPNIFVWKIGKKNEVINKDTALNLVSLFITELLYVLEGQSTDDLFLKLFFSNASYSFKLPGEEALSGGIASWLQKYYLTGGNYRPQIVITEKKDETFLLDINIHERHLSLEKPKSFKDILCLKKYDIPRYEILQSITLLSSFINGLDAYINSKGEDLMVMDMKQFTPFLIEIIPAIELLDVDILLPKSLQQILKPKASVKIKKKKGKSFLRIDELLDFDWQIAIGDNLIEEAEFNKLCKNADGLIKYKSQYIYVNKIELEKIHKHFTSNKKISPLEMLRIALSEEYHGSSISMDDEVKELIRKLTDIKEVPLPKALSATLRPYQHRGYSWMYRNSEIGFGSVIADDMGLGKTLQVIATILKFKETGMLEDKKIIVVVPTGLLVNWQAEIEKFAPSLKSHIFHGNQRKINENFDVLLTSYGIVRNETDTFKKMSWYALIIDEAQNIKNHDTAQSKAVKSIKADNFIAMSGTPVENRLSELWSIFDFSNRGMLGNAKEFNESYGAPIETYNDLKVATKLKKVTSPFMMRRLKSDKTIISDLPDKIETDCLTFLVKEQASLYRKTLEEAMKEIEGIDASDKKGLFVRQGLVLQMILALKQICNHPTQFLKNNILKASLSGKLQLLFDKLDSIIESQEKVLIFTQFTEMGNLLQHFITERYGEKPLFYHGGCSIKQRKEMVDQFQTNHADKLFILSLKAAGTGLNLTAANHVIHYDLWWNPAVEAQATDRAYRIGQKKNVQVHRFITKNTFEERINDMIQSKKALAQMTVTTGENWIGNLSNKELKELFIMSS